MKIKKLLEGMRSIFLNGLLTILPMTITFALFSFSLKVIKKWLSPVYELEPQYLKAIPGFEIIIVLLFIFLLGIILRFFILSHIIHAVEKIFDKIPLLSPVYFGIKQIVQGFTGKDKDNFQSVVFVEFPKAGVYSLGFLTGELPEEVAPNIKEKLYSVFIPTSPNPTTGFYAAVKKADFFAINLTKQQAIAIIISGGIISPEKFERTHIDQLN